METPNPVREVIDLVLSSSDSEPERDLDGLVVVDDCDDDESDDDESEVEYSTDEDDEDSDGPYIPEIRRFPRRKSTEEKRAEWAKLRDYIQTNFKVQHMSEMDTFLKKEDHPLSTKQVKQSLTTHDLPLSHMRQASDLHLQQRMSSHSESTATFIAAESDYNELKIHDSKYNTYRYSPNYSVQSTIGYTEFCSDMTYIGCVLNLPSIFWKGRCHDVARSLHQNTFSKLWNCCYDASKILPIFRSMPKDYSPSQDMEFCIMKMTSLRINQLITIAIVAESKVIPYMNNLKHSAKERNEECTFGMVLIIGQVPTATIGSKSQAKESSPSHESDIKSEIMEKIEKLQSTSGSNPLHLSYRISGRNTANMYIYLSSKVHMKFKPSDDAGNNRLLLDPEKSKTKPRYYNHGDSSSLISIFEALIKLKSIGAAFGPVKGWDSDGVLNYFNVADMNLSKYETQRSTHDDDVDGLLNDVSVAAPGSQSNTSQYPQTRPDLSPVSMPEKDRPVQNVSKHLQPFLRPHIQLKTYQIKGVEWMQMREQAPTDLLYPRLHPEWNQYFIPFQFPRKYPQRRFRALYVHKFKNVVSRAFPLAPSKQSTCGGFLCDEMGLGKTIETLALVAVSPPPALWLNPCNYQHGVRSPKFRDINRVTMTKWTPVAVRSTLIVAPMTLIDQWISEIHKFFQPGKLACAIYSPLEASRARVLRQDSSAKKHNKRNIGEVFESSKKEKSTENATEGHSSPPRKRRSTRARRAPIMFTIDHSSQTQQGKLAHSNEMASDMREQNLVRRLAIVEGCMLKSVNGDFLQPEHFQVPSDFPDIIFCSYETLRRELRNAHTFTKTDVRYSLPPKTEHSCEPVHMPLCQLGFWRVCLDEAQLVNNSSSVAAIAASQLWRRFAWVCTGTPLVRNYSEIHGLLSFLSHQPFMNKTLFENLICHSKRGRVSLLRHLMLRRHKQQAHIMRQLEFPFLHFVQRRLNFSKTELVCYQHLQKALAKVYSKVKNRRAQQRKRNKWLSSGESSSQKKPKSVTPAMTAKKRNTLMADLTRLRQACCHPLLAKSFLDAATSKNKPNTGKSTLSMTEITHKLLTKAHQKHENALRDMYMKQLKLIFLRFVQRLPFEPVMKTHNLHLNWIRLILHISLSEDKSIPFDYTNSGVVPVQRYLLPKFRLQIGGIETLEVERTYAQLLQLQNEVMKASERMSNVRNSISSLLNQAHFIPAESSSIKFWSIISERISVCLTVVEKLLVINDNKKSKQVQHMAIDFFDCLCLSQDVVTLMQQDEHRHETRKRKKLSKQKRTSNMKPAMEFSFWAEQWRETLLRVTSTEETSSKPAKVAKRDGSSVSSSIIIESTQNESNCDSQDTSSSSSSVSFSFSSSASSSLISSIKASPSSVCVPLHILSTSRVMQLAICLNTTIPEREHRKFLRSMLLKRSMGENLDFVEIAEHEHAKSASNASTLQRAYEVNESRMKAHMKQQMEVTTTKDPSDDHTQDQDDHGPKVCPICMEALGEGGLQNWVLTSCGHDFCWDCMEMVLQRHGHAPCPICREKLSKTDLFHVKSKTKIVKNKATKNSSNSITSGAHIQSCEEQSQERKATNLIAKASEQPHGQINAKEQAAIKKQEMALDKELLESGVASSVQEKFGSKMFALLREILLTKRLESINLLHSAKVVIFSSWCTLLELASRMLIDNGINAVVFRGSSSVKTQQLRRFHKLAGQSEHNISRSSNSNSSLNENQDYVEVILIPLFVGLGAAGLNLTNAATVIFLEPPLRTSVEAQAVARVFRIGQLSPIVRAVTLLIDGSVEDKVLELRNKVKSKQKINVDSDTFAGLTAEEIEELITPSALLEDDNSSLGNPSHAAAAAKPRHVS